MPHASNITKLILVFYICFGVLLSCKRDKAARIKAEATTKIAPVDNKDLWNNKGVYGTFYSPDGKWISAGCGNGQIKVYNRKDLSLHCNLRFNDGPAHSTLFSANSKLLISSSYDSLIAIYNIDSCKLVKRNFQIKKGTYTAIFSNSGKYYAVCGADSTAKIFLYDNDSLVFDLHHPLAVHFIWYGNDDHYFATACDDGVGRIFDMQQNGKLVTELRAEGEPLYCIVIDDRNELVVSVGNDNYVRLWDLKKGTLLKTMKGHTSATFVALFSPDRKLIGSCSADGTIKVWETASGKLLRTLTGHTGVLSSLHFSPDGNELLSGSMDGTIRLWNVADGKCTATVKVVD